MYLFFPSNDTVLLWKCFWKSNEWFKKMKKIHQVGFPHKTNFLRKFTYFSPFRIQEIDFLGERGVLLKKVNRNNIVELKLPLS